MREWITGAKLVERWDISPEAFLQWVDDCTPSPAGFGGIERNERATTIKGNRLEWALCPYDSGGKPLNPYDLALNTEVERRAEEAEIRKSCQIDKKIKTNAERLWLNHLKQARFRFEHIRLLEATFPALNPTLETARPIPDSPPADAREDVPQKYTIAKGRWMRANLKAQDLVKNEPDITLSRIYEDDFIRALWPKGKMPKFSYFEKRIGRILGLKMGRRTGK